MPSARHDTKSNIEDDYNLIYSSIDDEGTPYVNPDEFNMLFDEEQYKWFLQIDDYIVELWEMIKTYIEDNNLPLLERCTFSKFVIFLNKHSLKVSLEQS